MNKAFQYHHEDNSISVRQERMNPSEVQQLIRDLQSHLTIALGEEEDYLSVLKRSVRLDRAHRTIYFRLSWNHPELKWSPDSKPPKPNVSLSVSEQKEYLRLIRNMASKI